MSNLPQGVQGITEDDIADYLANNPGFFERHAELLATVQLANPHGGRAVSLQERQMEMQRERVRVMERRMREMARAGTDNELLARRLHRWTCGVMRAETAEALHDALVAGLRDEFLIPQVALRLWGVDAEARWTEGVGEDLPTFAASLSAPYCGLNAGFEASRWLDGAPAQSLAMVPLRRDPADATCFGLLVLGSPDALRYQADMGTEFLEQVGDIAAAALARTFPAAA